MRDVILLLEYIGGIPFHTSGEISEKDVEVCENHDFFPEESGLPKSFGGLKGFDNKINPIVIQSPRR